MIDNVLELLQFAKKENWRGKHIDVALGKNKFPESISEMIKQTKREHETS